MRRSIFNFIPLLLLTLFCNTVSIAQENIISTTVQTFRIDPIGNCYFQNGTDIIRKNATSAMEVRFSMKDLGNPSSYDVSNPMRILVFYAEFAVIRILDNNLVLQSEIQLRELGILQPRVIAGSPDQSIWIFDEISGSLIKLNSRLGNIANTVDLNQLLGKRPIPTELVANQNWIVLAEKEELQIFDQFGTKVRSVKLKSPTRTLILQENELIISEDNQLVTIHLRTGIPSFKPIPCNMNADHFILQNDQCWMQFGTSLFSSRATY